MKAWKSYRQSGVVYSLEHLHSSSITYTPRGNPHGPVRDYKLIVGYSHHCFTRQPYDNENPSPDQWYPHADERRIFDQIRYEYSLNLPAIMTDIHNQQIWHTGHGNFLTVEMLSAQNVHHTYAVYFHLGRDSHGHGDLYIYVQSAYPRFDNPTPRKRRIRFQVIANDTFHDFKRT